MKRGQRKTLWGGQRLRIFQTHQSFSIAFAEIPEILEASFIDISLEASFKFFSHPIIIMNLKDFLQQSRSLLLELNVNYISDFRDFPASKAL
jgi:hypothetical protein